MSAVILVCLVTAFSAVGYLCYQEGYEKGRKAGGIKRRKSLLDKMYDK